MERAGKRVGQRSTEYVLVEAILSVPLTEYSVKDVAARAQQSYAVVYGALKRLAPEFLALIKRRHNAHLRETSKYGWLVTQLETDGFAVVKTPRHLTPRQRNAMLRPIVGRGSLAKWHWTIRATTPLATITRGERWTYGI